MYAVVIFNKYKKTLKQIIEQHCHGSTIAVLSKTLRHPRHRNLRVDGGASRFFLYPES